MGDGEGELRLGAVDRTSGLWTGCSCATGATAVLDKAKQIFGCDHFCWISLREYV